MRFAFITSFSRIPYERPDDFLGPLDRQLRDLLSYIKNYIIKEKMIKFPDQAETVRIFNLPHAAVEESLSNAVYHKSYQTGERITVIVTSDRMEISEFKEFFTENAVEYFVSY